MSDEALKQINALRELVEKKLATSSEAKPTQAKRPYRGKKQNGQNNKERTPMPPTNIGGSKAADLPAGLPLPGKYLSKNNSELSNDPLHNDAFFSQPSLPMSEVAEEHFVFSGCEAFPEVCDATYDTIIAANPDYKKIIPRSAHDYYLGMLLYARMLRCHQYTAGELTYDEQLFIEQVDLGNFQIPKSFELYLAGFGSTAVPGGSPLLFGFRHPELVRGEIDQRLEIRGYFGSIRRSPGLYASYPCPGVLAQRIVQDIRYTELPRNQPRNGNWNIPDAMAEGFEINRNCIGYRRATDIPEAQRECFEQARITGNAFPSKNGTLPFNTALMSYVSKKMQETRDLKLHSIPNSPRGSTGQLVFTRLTQQPTTYLVGGLFRGQSLLNMSATLSLAGSAFLYNVLKAYDNDEMQRSIMPVDFDEDDDIPDDMLQDMGYNLAHTEEAITIRRFTTTEIDVSSCLKRITDHDRC